jgi:hypothetical protein
MVSFPCTFSSAVVVMVFVTCCTFATLTHASSSTLVALFADLHENVFMGDVDTNTGLMTPYATVNFSTSIYFGTDPWAAATFSENSNKGLLSSLCSRTVNDTGGCILTVDVMSGKNTIVFYEEYGWLDLVWNSRCAINDPHTLTLAKRHALTGLANFSCCLMIIQFTKWTGAAAATHHRNASHHHSFQPTLL